MIEEKKQDQTKNIILLVLFFVGYAAFILVLQKILPPPESILEILKNLYLSYGYLLVFIAGVLEGIFLVGLYVPGSQTILLGGVMARTGVVQLPLVILFTTVGLLIGFSINYVLGKYGWYHVVEKFGLKEPLAVAKEKLEKHRKVALFFAYASPNSAAFITTAAGILRVPFKKFFLLSLIAQVVWSTIWGVLAYLIGPVLIELFLKYFYLIVLGIVLYWFLKKYLNKEKEA